MVCISGIDYPELRPLMDLAPDSPNLLKPYQLLYPYLIGGLPGPKGLIGLSGLVISKRDIGFAI